MTFALGLACFIPVLAAVYGATGQPLGDSLGQGRVLFAAGLVIGRGFAQIYVIIIGGQAVPLTLFPGMEVSSSFFDGAIDTYVPSRPEFGLGLGGIAIAAVVALIGLRNLPFLPENLTDPESPS